MRRLVIPVALPLWLAACGGADTPAAPKPDTPVTRPPEPVVATRVALTIPRGLLERGDSLRVAAIAVDAAGKALPDARIAFAVRPESIVTINDSGWVKGVGRGTVSISARVTGERAPASGAVADSAALEVRPLLRSIELVVPAVMAAGDTVAIQAIARDGTGAVIPDQGIQLVAEPSTVATVRGDRLIARATGRLGVTAIPLPSPFVVPEQQPRVLKPVIVQLLLREITAGGMHSCGLTAAGVAHCWGDGGNGLLGRGYTVTGLAGQPPEPVAGERLFAGIRASVYADGAGGLTCARAADGTPWCWGGGVFGELGDGVTTPERPYHVAASPTQLTTPGEVRQVAAGARTSCYLDASGQAWCAGLNNFGVLGSAPTGACTIWGQPCRPRFAPVSGGHAFRSMSIDAVSACGVGDAGDVWCWGRQDRLGSGFAEQASSPTPQRVAGPMLFDSVAVGALHSCALERGGAVWCWGLNGTGQLGSGDDQAQFTPSRVPTTVRFTSVAVGGMHSCGLTTDGAVMCWGDNQFGQLGSHTGRCVSSPGADPVECSRTLVKVALPEPAIGVSAGLAHGCAVTRSGAAWCWGSNVVGQAGGPIRTAFQPPTRIGEAP